MTRSIALLIAGAAAAASTPLPLQLALAILGIGVVGMAHGAGDLAVVDRTRRRTFLLAYGLVSVTTLLWWTIDPAVALPAFLLASAVHFGMEDGTMGKPVERVAHGVILVAAPATFHGPSYADLLRTAGGAASALPSCTPLLAVAGGAAGAVLLVLAWQRRDLPLAGGVAALLLMPPLIGFTVGFLILHAIPQTADRRDRLGYSDTSSYLRAVAPVFGGAILLASLVGALLLHFDSSGVRGLFAGIAALAVPHLLVTPWFEGHVIQREPALAGRLDRSVPCKR